MKYPSPLAITIGAIIFPILGFYLLVPELGWRVTFGSAFLVWGLVLASPDINHSNWKLMTSNMKRITELLKVLFQSNRP